MGKMKNMEEKIGSGFHELLGNNLDLKIPSDFVKEAGFKHGEVLSIDVISPKTIVVTKEYDEYLIDEIKG